MQIPRSVLGVAATSLADHYTHSQLDSLFFAAGFPGDPPGGNKVDKCLNWMRHANSVEANPLALFGELIAEFMETEPPAPTRDWLGDAYEEGPDRRDALRNALAKASLTYREGGRIDSGSLSRPSATLAERLKEDGLRVIEQEFERAHTSVDADPPTAVTAACALLESVCKTFLEQFGKPMPARQTLGDLWKLVSAELNFQPGVLEDNDLRKIITGLFSIVDGIGALRTHAGSAHGRSPEQSKAYKIEPRHARLAVHSAHTAALFVMESWQRLRRPATTSD